MTEPKHKLSASLKTPSGITGIVVEALPNYDAVLEFYVPWAEAGRFDGVEDLLRTKNLSHPMIPTRTDQVFYVLYVASRPDYPFVVGEVNCRVMTPGNGKRPPIELTIPEPEEDELELEEEAPVATPVNDAASAK